eukprot:scaffold5198_cov173-Amphora_coffeaeformis.AAC.5
MNNNESSSPKKNTQTTSGGDSDTAATSRAAPCPLRHVCAACQQSKPTMAFSAVEWTKDADQELICSACRQVQHYQFCVR